MTQPAQNFVAIVDIDDVLSDSVPVYLDALNTELNLEHSEYDMRAYDFTDGLGIPLDAVLEVVKSHSILKSLQPLPSSVEGMRRLKQTGFHIVLATAREETERMPTQEWLHMHGFPYDELLMGQDKLKVTQKFSGYYVVAFEDRLDTATTLAEAANIVFILNRAWNSRTSIYPSNIIRVSGWKDILEMALSLVDEASQLRNLFSISNGQIRSLASHMVRNKRYMGDPYVLVCGKSFSNAQSGPQFPSDLASTDAILDDMIARQLEHMLVEGFIRLIITTRTDHRLEEIVDGMNVDWPTRVLINGNAPVDEIASHIESSYLKNELLILKLHGQDQDVALSSLKLLELESKLTGLLRNVLKRNVIILGQPLDFSRYIEPEGGSLWYVGPASKGYESSYLSFAMEVRGSSDYAVAGLYGYAWNFFSALTMHLQDVSSDETLSLEDSLRVVACKHNLPRRVHRELIGRETEVSKLRKLLSLDSRIWLASIEGIGGVGKTALALEVAYSFLGSREEYQGEFDTIVWTSVTKVVSIEDKRNLSEDNVIVFAIMTNIANVLNRQDILHANNEKQRNMVYVLLSRKRALLVIDGLEQANYPGLVAFLSSLPSPTKILITSKERFELATPIKLMPLSKDSAVDLVKHESIYYSVNINSATTKTIAQRTDGIPLAIAWTVAQLSVGSSLSSLADRLTVSGEDVCQRVFQRSVNLLSDDELEALYIVSLFPQGARRETIANVLGLDANDINLDRNLSRITALSLVSLQDDKIIVLQLTKKFLESYFKRSLPDLQRRSKSRWLSVVTTMASKYAIGYWEFRDYSGLMLHNEDFKAALELALESGRGENAYALMRAYSFGCIYMGSWEELIATGMAFSAAMESLQMLHAVAWAEACVMGWVFTHQDVLDKAEPSLSKAMSIYTRLNDRRGIAQVTRLLGRLREKQKRYSESMELVIKAQDMIESLGWDWEMGFALYDRGWIARSMRDYGQAKKYLEQAEVVLQQAMEPEIAGLFVTGIQEAIAHIAYEESNYQEAIDLCNAALAFYSDAGTAFQGYRPPRIQLLMVKALVGLDRFQEASTLLEPTIVAFEELDMQTEAHEASRLMSGLMTKIQIADDLGQHKSKQTLTAPGALPQGTSHVLGDSNTNRNAAEAMIKILFLSANPTDTTRLRLDEEIRAVDQSLRQTKFRSRFDIKQHWAVRVSELQGYLLRHEPHILHFSGHGSDRDALFLEGESGKSQPISSRALGSLFSVLKGNIRCVVLNACYSESQARAIAKHVDCVVGMSHRIGDKSSIAFAAAFYQALGYGHSVKSAFDLACVQIDLEGLNDQDVPKLITVSQSAEEIIFAH